MPDDTADLETSPMLGEVWGSNEVQHKFTDPPGVLGLNWCGSEDAWLHGVPYAQRGLPVDVEGRPLCCIRADVGRGGLLIGGRGTEATNPAEVGRGGLALAGRGLELGGALEVGRGGMALAGRGEELAGALEVGRGGLALGGRGEELAGALEVGRGGLALGGAGEEMAVTEIDTAGWILGGPIVATGTITHLTSAVSPGSYDLASITVDGAGHLTGASTGTVGKLIVTTSSPISPSPTDGKAPIYVLPTGTSSPVANLPTSPPTGFTTTIVNPVGNGVGAIVPPAGVAIGQGLAGAAVPLNPGFQITVGYTGTAWVIIALVTADPSVISSAPPGIPTALTASPGNAKVMLSWTAPGGTPAAASYNVWYKLHSASSYSFAANTTSTSYTKTGLTNGTTYDFEVSAVAASGQEGGRTSAVSQTPSAATLLDTFHGTNGTLLPAHTPDIVPSGSAWANVSGGNFQIEGNTAQAISGAAAVNLCSIDSTKADTTITGVFTTPANISGAAQSDICFRFSDSSHYWLAQASWGSNLFRLLKNVAGTFTTVGSTSFTFAANTTYTVVVTLSGSSISITLNGGSGLSTTDTFNDTQTNHGLFDTFTSPSTAASWSKFQVA